MKRPPLRHKTRLREGETVHPHGWPLRHNGKNSPTAMSRSRDRIYLACTLIQLQLHRDTHQHCCSLWRLFGKDTQKLHNHRIITTTELGIQVGEQFNLLIKF